MMQLMLMPEVEASDEDALIRAAVAGDRAAFGEIYVRYARMVHGILLARVPPSDAEDLVQDVFLAAMRQLRGLRTAAAFRGWLGAIARNRAIDFHRSSRARVPLDEAAPPTARATDGHDAFLVLAAIRALPEAYRETLILRLVEGMTGPEIALQTGLTADSVRVNLCRGMKMLREKLESK
jgi:RNA polymerase sigma-70 factor (ECF subfamily)